jgi:hypothetical protein
MSKPLWIATTIMVGGLLIGSTGTGSFYVDTTVAFAEEHPGGIIITETRVMPRHKAVRLTWKATVPEQGPVTFEIRRSMVSPDGDEVLVTTIEAKPGENSYRYVDKSVPVEENYFYKIVIPETGETMGPFQARPPFSLPST